MRVRFIASLREFDALRSIWAEVTRQSGQASPFLSHDWFASCWRTAGANCRREVWMVEDVAGPVAFIPLMYFRTRHRRLPVRAVSLLEAPGASVAGILVAGAVDCVASAFWRTLRERRDWDIVSLQNLPADSMVASALERAGAERPSWRRLDGQPLVYIRVSGGWNEFLLRGGETLREFLRAIEDGLPKHGHVTVEQHHELDPDGPAFAEVMEVSRLGWRTANGASGATLEGMPRFFRELAVRASSNGWLCLWILRLDGRAVATEYQIRSKGLLHALRHDADSGLANLFPGAALRVRVLRSLFDRQDVSEYHIGRGGDAAGYSWAAEARETVSFRAYAGTHYGRVLRWLDTRDLPSVTPGPALPRASAAD